MVKKLLIILIGTLEFLDAVILIGGTLLICELVARESALLYTKQFSSLFDNETL